MDMSVDQEWRRLQALYAGMSDGQLLKLAGEMVELTEVAQQAVEAEVSSRGLKLEEESAADVEAEMPELEPAEGDPSLVELKTFQLAMEAQTAARLLEEHEIPMRMEQAMRRFTEDGPKIKTNWLTIFVERERQKDAVELLRERMGLFPLMKPEEVGDPGNEGGADTEEELLSVMGSFDVDADAEVARNALTVANIWFQAEKENLEDWAGTTIAVRMEDLDRALAAVETAFGEEG